MVPFSCTEHAACFLVGDRTEVEQGCRGLLGAVGSLVVWGTAQTEQDDSGRRLTMLAYVFSLVSMYSAFACVQIICEQSSRVHLAENLAITMGKPKMGSWGRPKGGSWKRMMTLD